MSKFWENRNLFAQTTPKSLKNTSSLTLDFTKLWYKPNINSSKAICLHWANLVVVQSAKLVKALETKVLYFVEGTGRNVTDFSALPSHMPGWLVWATLQVVMVLLLTIVYWKPNWDLHHLPTASASQSPVTWLTFEPVAEKCNFYEPADIKYSNSWYTVAVCKKCWTSTVTAVCNKKAIPKVHIHFSLVFLKDVC